MSAANIETVSTAGDKAKLVLVGLLVVAAVAGFYTLADRKASCRERVYVLV